MLHNVNIPTGLGKEILVELLILYHFALWNVFAYLKSLNPCSICLASGYPGGFFVQLEALSIIKYNFLVLTLQEWEMLSFIRSLKSMVRYSNAVAVITFPPALVSPSFSKRWQHLADTLLSVKAIPGIPLAWYHLVTYVKDDPQSALFYQMRTRNWRTCSRVIMTWLGFSMCTKWPILIPR